MRTATVTPADIELVRINTEQLPLQKSHHLYTEQDIEDEIKTICDRELKSIDQGLQLLSTLLRSKVRKLWCCRGTAATIGVIYAISLAFFGIRAGIDFSKEFERNHPESGWASAIFFAFGLATFIVDCASIAVVVKIAKRIKCCQSRCFSSNLRASEVQYDTFMSRKELISRFKYTPFTKLAIKYYMALPERPDLHIMMNDPHLIIRIAYVVEHNGLVEFN